MSASASIAGTIRPRVLVVAGTRPEAIKMAPVFRALRARADEVDAHFVCTGQHAELVDDVLARFGIVPTHHLALMRSGQDLYDLAHGCLDGLRQVVRETRARGLLVQGDTATVAFGALVGFFERIWVGHVEAGLRSGDPDQPWPEENLRRITDVLSHSCFAPTQWAADNLRREHHPRAAIHITGNTVVDALHQVAGEAGDAFDDAHLHALMAAIETRGHRMVLLTAHRRESFGEPLQRVFSAVRALAEAHADIEVVFPVHPNPQVREAADHALHGLERVHMIAPVDYFDLVRLLQRAVLVLTDSGGIQEEAPTFSTPTLVLREVTERPEGVAAGVAQLVGTDPEKIGSAADAILAQAQLRRPRNSTGGVWAPSPYGDGHAAERIADLTIHALVGSERRTRDWMP